MLIAIWIVIVIIVVIIVIVDVIIIVIDDMDRRVLVLIARGSSLYCLIVCQRCESV